MHTTYTRIQKTLVREPDVIFSTFLILIFEGDGCFVKSTNYLYSKLQILFSVIGSSWHDSRSGDWALHNIQLLCQLRRQTDSLQWRQKLVYERIRFLHRSISMCFFTFPYRNFNFSVRLFRIIYLHFKGIDITYFVSLNICRSLLLT